MAIYLERLSLLFVLVRVDQLRVVLQVRYTPRIMPECFKTQWMRRQDRIIYHDSWRNHNHVQVALLLLLLLLGGVLPLLLGLGCCARLLVLRQVV